MGIPLKRGDEMAATAAKFSYKMTELVRSGQWAVVPSLSPTVRHTVEVPTPEYASQPGPGSIPAMWGEPTYSRHLFVTLVNNKVIVGTANAPWVGRRDRVVPFWLANAILDDPDLAFDTSRQHDMRHARRDPRGTRK